MSIENDRFQQALADQLAHAEECRSLQRRLTKLGNMRAELIDMRDPEGAPGLTELFEEFVRLRRQLDMHRQVLEACLEHETRARDKAAARAAELADSILTEQLLPEAERLAA